MSQSALVQMVGSAKDGNTTFGLALKLIFCLANISNSNSKLEMHLIKSDRMSEHIQFTMARFIFGRALLNSI